MAKAKAVLEARHKLQIEWLQTAALAANPGNARTHSDKQVRQLASSIRKLGFINPIIIDDSGTVMAGHCRLAAAKLLGAGRVPVLRVSNLSEAEKRAYVLADNRLAELAGWDRNLLAVEFKYLTAPMIDFDVAVTGFETRDIDLTLDPKAEPSLDPAADAVVEPGKGPAVARQSDVWRLGRHHLMCGDARDPEIYKAVLGGDLAHMVFADPPYNVPIAGHVQGKGRIKHKNFVMAAGEMGQHQFTEFLRTTMANCAAQTIDGSIHYYCMDWRHLREILDAGTRVYPTLKNFCIWNKDVGGMGSFYRSKHELILVFKNGSAPHINNFGLGENGRYRTNVWDYPGVNAAAKSRKADLELHPTVKPVALVMDAIKDVSHRNQIVLDPFVGSGTTIIAAEKTGRRAVGIELDPKFVDVAIRRFETVTGQKATLEGTDQTFATVAVQRGGAGEEAVSGAARRAPQSRQLKETEQ